MLCRGFWGSIVCNSKATAAAYEDDDNDDEPNTKSRRVRDEDTVRTSNPLNDPDQADDSRAAPKAGVRFEDVVEMESAELSGANFTKANRGIELEDSSAKNDASIAGGQADSIKFKKITQVDEKQLIQEMEDELLR